MKKQLSIKERVDILMDAGIEHPEKWMAKHSYVDPTEIPRSEGGWTSNNSAGWATEWRKLRDHHLQETNLLFDIIKELKERLEIK